MQNTNILFWRLAAACIVILFLTMTTFQYSLSSFGNELYMSSPNKAVRGSAENDGQSVAFCVLAKDEHDLYEWIDYHRQLGVSKFYVLDENSDPPMSLQIPNFIQSGLVEYSRYSFYWTNVIHSLGFDTKNHLRVAFDECLHKHGHKHDWIGFFDADEFVILKDETMQSLPEFLNKYKDYGGVVVNWMLFGSSGHVKRPPGGILKSYYRCVPNGTIKTIVNVKHTIGTGGNCHYFTYKEPYFAVNGNFNRIDGNWASPVELDTIYINHYKTKSLEDFNNKLARWGKTKSSKTYKANLSPDLIYSMDRMMVQNCSIPKMNITIEYRKEEEVR